MEDQLLSLHTENLTLRQFQLTDASQVQKLAGDPAISSTTLLIPYPYLDGMAESFIESLEPDRLAGKSVVFAIVDKSAGFLIGTMGLTIEQEHSCGELGFWIGRPYWGRGYATGAAGAVLKYGFEVLGLNCIHGRHFLGNEASGKVMTKIGMKYEGTLRQRKKKNGEFKDLVEYSILKPEFQNRG